jgi:NAD(P)-dependent dehydrogenase (short-subunit alcohol dehydrogenase family)
MGPDRVIGQPGGNAIAVVTGAGSGIGRATAVGLAARGWRVFGAARGADSLKYTAAQCPAGSFEGTALDVADRPAVQQWIDAIANAHGSPDGLVCSAAIYPRGHFLDQPAQEWDEVIAINVLGGANACRAVLPGMLRRRSGRIVIIGSLANLRPIPGASAYSVSKGALHALTLALAAEIDRTAFPRVQVNEYLPSATKSGMNGFGVEPEWHVPHILRLLGDPGFTSSGQAHFAKSQMRLDGSLKSALRNAAGKISSRLR